MKTDPIVKHKHVEALLATIEGALLMNGYLNNRCK